MYAPSAEDFLASCRCVVCDDPCWTLLQSGHPLCTTCHGKVRATTDRNPVTRAPLGPLVEDRGKASLLKRVFHSTNVGCVPEECRDLFERFKGVVPWVAELEPTTFADAMKELPKLREEERCFAAIEGLGDRICAANLTRCMQIAADPMCSATIAELSAGAWASFSRLIDRENVVSCIEYVASYKRAMHDLNREDELPDLYILVDAFARHGAATKANVTEILRSATYQPEDLQKEVCRESAEAALRLLGAYMDVPRDSAAMHWVACTAPDLVKALRWSSKLRAVLTADVEEITQLCTATDPLSAVAIVEGIVRPFCEIEATGHALGREVPVEDRWTALRSAIDLVRPMLKESAGTLLTNAYNRFEPESQSGFNAVVLHRLDWDRDWHIDCNPESERIVPTIIDALSSALSSELASLLDRIIDEKEALRPLLDRSRVREYALYF